MQCGQIFLTILCPKTAFIVEANRKFSALILKNSDSGTIEREAVENGMITMKQDGYLKVLQGITTVEEILRVAQE